MNDSDVVVGGSSYDPSWPSRHRPFSSVAGGALQYLGSFGGNDGEARGINNAGQIVGKGTINGQTHAFLLTLSAAPESITPTSQSFTTTGGSSFAHVTSPGGTAWSAASNANWITLQSGTSGAGNGVIIYNVTPTATPRTGTITIAGQTFTVIQEASTEAVSTATISGRVTAANGSPVKGSVLTLSGSQSGMTTTDANGNYSFSGLPTGGNYTVAASKTGDVNGISAFDASMAARFAVGLITLTTHQQVAADASNNGSVSAFDASSIARTALGGYQHRLCRNLEVLAAEHDLQQSLCGPDEPEFHGRAGR